MKNFFALTAVAVFGLLMFSCQKQSDTDFFSTPVATVLSGDRSNDCCAGDWTPANHNTQTFLLGGPPQNLYLDVWNDEFNTHYRLYRNPTGNMASVRYAVGAPCTDPLLNGTPNFQNVSSCTWDVAINNTNWQSCDSKSITIRVTGMGGGAPNYQDCTNYSLKAKSPVAAAGPDQRVCNTNVFTMAAVPSIGSGSWAFNGPSGSAVITTPSSATTTITNVPTDMDIKLVWTENNHGCTSSDEVVIRNDAQPVANAGSDQLVCNTANFTMAAVPSVGSGVWTFVGASGSAQITTPSSATTTVTGLTAGQSVTLLWTETNGTCSSSDEVTITNKVCQEVCYASEGNSAMSAGALYEVECNPRGAPWATYTSYSGAAQSVALEEGNNHTNAGTVSFSAPSGGMVTITVTMNAAYGFNNVAENVKIQGYGTDPVCTDHEPGHFDNKGTATGSSFSMTVPQANFYGVHVDVRKVVPCPQ